MVFLTRGAFAGARGGVARVGFADRDMCEVCHKGARCRARNCERRHIRGRNTFAAAMNVA